MTYDDVRASAVRQIATVADNPVAAVMSIAADADVDPQAVTAAMNGALSIDQDPGATYLAGIMAGLGLAQARGAMDSADSLVDLLAFIGMIVRPGH